MGMGLVSYIGRFDPGPYLKRRPGGPHSQTGRGGDEKKPLSQPEIEPRTSGRPSRSLEMESVRTELDCRHGLIAGYCEHGEERRVL